MNAWLPRRVAAPILARLGGVAAANPLEESVRVEGDAVEVAWVQGGGRIGRGFEAAAVSGDRGVGGKAQLTRRVGESVTWLERGDLYGFYDIGSAWRNDAGGRESASSTGVGPPLRDGRLSGSIELARPLTHADAGGRKDVGIFAEISIRF